MILESPVIARRESRCLCASQPKCSSPEKAPARQLVFYS
jgi:hypothetical protein